MNNMILKSFTRDDFAEYLSWFSDEKLNSELGPMDDDWLEYVMSDTTGKQYIMTDGAKMYGCVGVALPNHQYPYYFITDIAINPKQKHKGYGTMMLEMLIRHPLHQQVQRWECIIAEHNQEAQRFFKKIGWKSYAKIDKMISFFYIVINPDLR